LNALRRSESQRLKPGLNFKKKNTNNN